MLSIGALNQNCCCMAESYHRLVRTFPFQPIFGHREQKIHWDHACLEYWLSLSCFSVCWLCADDGTPECMLTVRATPSISDVIDPASSCTCANSIAQLKVHSEPKTKAHSNVWHQCSWMQSTARSIALISHTCQGRCLHKLLAAHVMSEVNDRRNSTLSCLSRPDQHNLAANTSLGNS